MVSIAAFQAVDPGSIPGWRSFLSFFLRIWMHQANFSAYLIFIVLDLKYVLQEFLSTFYNLIRLRDEFF